MDFSQYNLSENAEKGIDYVVKNPLDGKDTDAVISILGSDSKAYRNARSKCIREAAINKDKELDEDKASVEIYAACVTGWSGVNHNGKGLDCTPENITMLFSEYKWLLDQVGRAIDTRSNFTKPVGIV